MRKRIDVERAATLLEVMLVAAVGMLLVSSVVFAATTFSHASVETQKAATEQQTTQAVIDVLNREATSATAIFTPARDTGNADNSDGHELDAYIRDAAGGGHFTAFCWKKTSAVCGGSANPAPTFSLVAVPYSWAQLPQNGGAGVYNAAQTSKAVAPYLTSFASKTILASSLINAAQNPTTAAYFSQIGISSVVDVARNTGFPGVVSGNRVTIVSVGSDYSARLTHLLPEARSTHRNVIVSTYTPPPQTMTATGPGGSAPSLAFANPLAAAQQVTFAENNYGTRSTTPAQVYSVIGTTCSGNASYTPSTITPVANGTGTGTMSVAPVVKTQPSGATCTIVVSDNSGQTQTVTVQIGQTYPPSASAPGAGRPGQTGIFAIQEQNYPTSPFSISLGGVCNNATIASSAQSSGSYVEQIQVTYTAAGVCSISATDAYGQTTTSSVTVYNNPTYALAVSAPSPSTMTIGNSATWTATATLSNSNAPPGTPSTIPVGISASSGPCNFSPGGWQNSGTTFTASGTAAGTCTATMSADASGVSGATVSGNNQSVTVTVTNPPPPFVAGSCTATADATNPSTALDINCTAPSGGSGSGYAVQQYAAHQTGTILCNWAAYSCVVSNLSPATSYNFSPYFGDGSSNRAWGGDFSGTTRGSQGSGGSVVVLLNQSGSDTMVVNGCDPNAPVSAGNCMPTTAQYTYTFTVPMAPSTSATALTFTWTVTETAADISSISCGATSGTLYDPSGAATTATNGAAFVSSTSGPGTWTLIVGASGTDKAADGGGNCSYNYKAQVTQG